ncbi:MAG: hypothetical protein QG635_1890, partial [Bacteroidota bacterium]|nr:hypothetical protein [Bacteroidota bacterium]
RMHLQLAKPYIYMMRHLGFSKRDVHREYLLKLLKPFIMDTIYSIDCRSFELYNINKIESAVKDYYSGRKDNSVLIDNWLSFEMFRQGLI